MSDDLLSLFEQLDNSHDDKRLYKRCPLNYVGSKRETLQPILNLLPYRNTWVDVFGGSGVVTLARKPSKLDVYNDRHSGICAFYRALKERPQELLAQIELMPHARELFEWAKATEHLDTDDVVRGAKWYYLIQASFGGKYDCWGRVTSGKNTILNKLFNNLKLFPIVHERIKKLQIENLDWQQIIKDYDGHDVVFYFDPPYVDSNQYSHTMSYADHHKLCQAIMELNGFCALSGYDNEIYNSYDWSGKHVFDLKNRISSPSDRGTVRLECLWIKE